MMTNEPLCCDQAHMSDKLTDRQKKMVERLIQIYKDYYGWELESEDAVRVRTEKAMIQEALGLNE